MPQVTAYIREEDIDKWKSIDKKSEFLHAALNNLDYQPTTEPKYTAPTESIYAPITTSPIKQKVTTSIDPVEETPKLKVLDNDALKELLASSGKKPITSDPTHVCKDTCKHWVWDTNRGGRTNTLTGEFQEGEPW